MAPLFFVEWDGIVDNLRDELEFLVFILFLHGCLVSLVDIMMISQALGRFKDSIKVKMVDLVAPKFVSHNLNRIELFV